MGFFPFEPEQDPGYYHANAERLVAGEPYGDPGRQAHYPPGMSLLLAAVYLVTGPSVLAGKLANIFLGVVMVYLVYDLARRTVSIMSKRYR